jgi:hypothetical protein
MESLVHNANGSWTVYVKGEWNWLSHNSDCNFDRAAAGVAMIWNDPNEPGYTITQNGPGGTSITASVGVAEMLNGDTNNQIDGEVHPADVGQQGPPASEMAPGVTGQHFFDPAPTVGGGDARLRRLQGWLWRRAVRRLLEPVLDDDAESESSVRFLGL